VCTQQAGRQSDRQPSNGGTANSNGNCELNAGEKIKIFMQFPFPLFIHDGLFGFQYLTLCNRDWLLDIDMLLSPFFRIGCWIFFFLVELAYMIGSNVAVE
jgi:hypothetical protein